MNGIKGVGGHGVITVIERKGLVWNTSCVNDRVSISGEGISGIRRGQDCGRNRVSWEAGLDNALKIGGDSVKRQVIRLEESKILRHLVGCEIQETITVINGDGG